MIRTKLSRDAYYSQYNPLCDLTLFINTQLNNPHTGTLYDKYTYNYCRFGENIISPFNNSSWPIHTWVYEARLMRLNRIDKLIETLQYMGPITTIYFLTWLYSGVYPVIPYDEAPEIKPIYFMPTIDRLISLNNISVYDEIIITSHLIILDVLFAQDVDINSFSLQHNITLLYSMLNSVISEESSIQTWTTIYKNLNDLLNILEPFNPNDYDQLIDYRRLQVCFYILKSVFSIPLRSINIVMNESHREIFINLLAETFLEYDSELDFEYYNKVLDVLNYSSSEYPFINNLPYQLSMYYNNYLSKQNEQNFLKGDCIIFKEEDGERIILGYCDASLLALKCPFARKNIIDYINDDLPFQTHFYEVMFPQEIDSITLDHLLFYYYTGIYSDYSSDNISYTFSSTQFMNSLNNMIISLNRGKDRNIIWEFGYLNPLLSYFV